MATGCRARMRASSHAISSNENVARSLRSMWYRSAIRRLYFGKSSKTASIAWSSGSKRSGRRADAHRNIGFDE